MNDLIEEIPRHIRRRIPDCKGMIFAGSRLRGEGTKNSDWDFCVIVGNRAKNKNGKRYFKFQDEIIDIFYNDWDSIKARAQGRDKDCSGLYMLDEGKIVWSESETVHERIEGFKKMARKTLRSDAPERDKFHIARCLKTYLKELENARGACCPYLQTDAMIHAVESLYMLSRVWLPGQKTIDKDLRSMDSKAYNIYESAHLTSCVNRIDKTIELIEYIIKKFHIDLNQVDCIDPQSIDTPFNEQEGLEVDFFVQIRNLRSMKQPYCRQYFPYMESIFLAVQYFYKLNRRMMPGFKYRDHELEYKPFEILEDDVRNLDEKWYGLYRSACDSVWSERIENALRMLEYLIDKFEMQYEPEEL